MNDAELCGNVIHVKIAKAYSGSSDKAGNYYTIIWKSIISIVLTCFYSVAC